MVDVVDNGNHGGWLDLAAPPQDTDDVAIFLGDGLVSFTEFTEVPISKKGLPRKGQPEAFWEETPLAWHQGNGIIALPCSIYGASHPKIKVKFCCNAQ